MVYVYQVSKFWNKYSQISYRAQEILKKICLESFA